ncbi:MAG: TetR/AcrR family transcriptional regulator [Steroidobacteraceae bacterium]
MGKRPSSGAGASGSLELWLHAAYELLLESGIEAVRIMPLAKRLRLSRTSFYWFFDDRESLLAALLERWRTKNTGNLVRQAESYAETLPEAILNVFDCWFDDRLFDSRLEFAVRSWAQQSRRVAGEVTAADADRLRSLASMFVRFDCNRVEADVRARTVYLTQLGYISQKAPEQLGVRMKRIGKYIEIFAGVPAEPRELNRFFARHGYRPKRGVPSS